MELINMNSPGRLDWDIAIEATRTILNEIVAWAGRETLMERQQPKPDLRRIRKLNSWRRQAMRDNHPGNFQELALMIAIIEKYSEVINKNL